jgi:predicted transcriptional regulator
MENVHSQLIVSDRNRMHLLSKAERVEADSIKMEREAEAEKLQQEQEKQVMFSSYEKLEKVVISHLKNFRVALEDDSDA